MLQTLEATIDAKGRVKLAESVHLRGQRRALVTILDEDTSTGEVPNEAALLSESALADWLSPEEDEAWAHLATLPDLDQPRGRPTSKKKGRK